MPGPTRAAYNQLKERVEAYRAMEKESEKEAIAAFRRAENVALQVLKNV